MKMGKQQTFRVVLTVTTDPEEGQITEKGVKRVLGKLINPDQADEVIRQIIIADVIETTK